MRIMLGARPEHLQRYKSFLHYLAPVAQRRGTPGSKCCRGLAEWNAKAPSGGLANTNIISTILT